MPPAVTREKAIARVRMLQEALDKNEELTGEMKSTLSYCRQIYSGKKYKDRGRFGPVLYQLTQDDARFREMVGKIVTIHRERALAADRLRRSAVATKRMVARIKHNSPGKPSPKLVAAWRNAADGIANRTSLQRAIRNLAGDEELRAEVEQAISTLPRAGWRWKDGQINKVVDELISAVVEGRATGDQIKTMHNILHRNPRVNETFASEVIEQIKKRKVEYRLRENIAKYHAEQFTRRFSRNNANKLPAPPSRSRRKPGALK